MVSNREQRTSAPPSVPRAPNKRRQDADHPEHAPGDVDHRGARAQRPTGRSGHIGQAPHHLGDLVQRRAVLIGTGEKPLGRTGDQARIARLEAVRAEPEALQGSRPIVLDHHVGGIDQPPRQDQAVGGLQIETDAALVAVEHREEAGAGAQQSPGRIAADRLDLDHLRAEIPQDDADRRPHDHMGELDHLDPGQREVFGFGQGGGGGRHARHLI